MRSIKVFSKLYNFTKRALSELASVVASVKEALSQRIKNYQNPTPEATKWIRDHWERIRYGFGTAKVRDYLFAPFLAAILTPSDKLDRDIYAVITQVAIINAVLAGLPGKLGVGVYISMALEAWMAFEIANHTLGRDQQLKEPSEVWKYFGIIGASIVGVLWVFKTILGFFFSLFSLLPWISPMIPAELLVTDFIGILLWLGFTQVRDGREFKEGIDIKEAMSRTKGLFFHQWELLKKLLSIENLTTVKNRVSAFLTGDIIMEPEQVRRENGEIFAAVAMAYLLSGQIDKLQGPLGETFIEAIRYRWSAQFDESTTVPEIAESFRQNYTDPAAIEGAVNTIKGKMFEILVTKQENSDGDNWRAEMHTDETFPGSDIIFTDSETGEQLEVSLKAVAAGREEIIEQALVKYPDIPIMATDEVAALYAADERVFGSGINNAELHNITRDNFEQMVNKIEVDPASHYEVIVGGVVVGTAAALWPFVISYYREIISKEQLKEVFEKVLGDGAVTLMLRVTGGFIIGPLFAWYLLAKGVKGMVEMAEEIVPQKKVVYRLAFRAV
ncbi:MAG: hypothetical protein HON83_09775 [Candidatus Marinimicrobia bacterium]|nr:hypothetical protein [Candidatus Neomarinimicrobiota bacterium]MBT6929648.1 hypothetical protein [Candidatus Neomarinimicrobiota bacterium]